MFEEEVRRHIHFAPAPSWVKELPFARPDLLDQSRAPWGLYTWLVDDQAKLDTRPHRYNRTIEEVVNLSALDYLANVTLPFNPYYDDLTIHHIRIIRGNEVIEVDVERRYFVMRRERSFERLVLDGRWTFAITLPDVRVGDIIDTALTLTGDPACFQGEITMPMPLQSAIYWDRRHVRLLVPPERKLNMKPFPLGWIPPKVNKLDDGYSEITFEDSHVFECDYEYDMPGWVIPARGFYASSIDSWERVGDLMRAGFEGDTDYPQGLLDEIARIEAEHADVRDRIVAAVRWVQENIRYFAFSFGEGGFVPRSLKEIYGDRIGDCKDVSKMIAAMLTRMGVESYPALVDTRRGHDLTNQPPRLGAFNHCISMCYHDGRTYWFEGTSSVAQGGDLDHLAQYDLGYALILKPGTDLIRMMDRPAKLEYEVREVINLPAKKGEQTVIEIDYIYRGARADAVRRDLRYQSLSSYVEDRCALFSYIYGMNMCAIPQMTDDRRLNEITINTFVTTDNPWQGGGGHRIFFSPESGFDYVLEDPEGRRRFPFDLGDVREGRITTVIKTDYKLDWPLKSKTWDFGGLVLGYTGRQTREGFEAVREYSVRRTWLSPDEKAKLDNVYAEVQDYDRLTVAVSGRKPSTWLPSAITRAVVWAGVPIVAVGVWAVFTFLL
ncbi:DUF3857 domain-containing protein [Asticcacaulis sp. AC460]|uniref:DUF3857 domain-containing protein n=1 Tax=Asticcacaulis sp. AC460 TaxID=1282360 RepID=UPI0004CE974D|nr:DUF3857 domain-containing protein [Asticcacaulis sp. AC460]